MHEEAHVVAPNKYVQLLWDLEDLAEKRIIRMKSKGVGNAMIYHVALCSPLYDEDALNEKLRGLTAVEPTQVKPFMTHHEFLYFGSMTFAEVGVCCEAPARIKAREQDDLSRYWVRVILYPDFILMERGFTLDHRSAPIEKLRPSKRRIPLLVTATKSKVSGLTERVVTSVSRATTFLPSI